MDRSGLTGRGGAGFPTARKLAAVAAGRAPVVVANGTEGEPASAKDKVLLARSPHLVLDGAVLAAELVGARRAVIVVHHAVREIIDEAVAERRRAAPTGSGQVVTAADRFVAGEASAVVHWIERGIPTPPRRHPGCRHAAWAEGRHWCRTSRRWPTWRSSAATARPGSARPARGRTWHHAGHRAGRGRSRASEIAIGTPVGEILDMAGGESAPLQALLIGGYFGRWVDAARPRTGPSPRPGWPLGAGPGAGLIAALPADACGLAETARVTRYLADESAGQCGPCLFGLDAIAGEVQRLAEGRTPTWPAAALARPGERARGCSHPDGAVRLISSALTVFAAELDRHAQGWCCGSAKAAYSPCPAVAAMSRPTLRVDPIACDGRGLCAEVLPELITLDDWGFPIIAAGPCRPAAGRRPRNRPRLPEARAPP